MVGVSVILPAYNEARVIADSLSRLAAFLDSDGAGGCGWEIVVVDDGSADATARLAQRASQSDPRIRVVRLGQNRGKGAATRAGIEASSGAVVLVTDVDLSYALEDLASAASTLARIPPAGSAPIDMVVGNRRHPESRLDLALSALGHVMRRQAISALFNFAVRHFFGLPWRDTQCGLKGFRREAALAISRRMVTRGFLADIEMFLIAERTGMAVVSIPVHLTCLSGESTVHVLRQGAAVIGDAIRIKRAQISGAYGTPETST